MVRGIIGQNRLTDTKPYSTMIANHSDVTPLLQKLFKSIRFPIHSLLFNWILFPLFNRFSAVTLSFIITIENIILKFENQLIFFNQLESIQFIVHQMPFISFLISNFQFNSVCLSTFQINSTFDNRALCSAVHLFCFILFNSISFHLVISL